MRMCVYNYCACTVLTQCIYIYMYQRQVTSFVRNQTLQRGEGEGTLEAHLSALRSAGCRNGMALRATIPSSVFTMFLFHAIRILDDVVPEKPCDVSVSTLFRVCSCFVVQLRLGMQFLPHGPCTRRAAAAEAFKSTSQRQARQGP